jgi:hypothetical protein
MRSRFTLIVAILLSLPLITAGAVRSFGAPLAAPASQTNLVYNPVTPCRVTDTRLAGGPLAANGTRSFLVTGNNLAAQGGNASGCGIPVGATSVVLNFVAVDPQGSGDLRETAFGTAMPLAAVLTYWNDGVPNANMSNGLPVPICDPAAPPAGGCSFDFTIQADAAATHLVIDVTGYFKLSGVSPTNVIAVYRTSGPSAPADSFVHDVVTTDVPPGNYVILAKTILVRTCAIGGTCSLAEADCTLTAEPIDISGLSLGPRIDLDTWEEGNSSGLYAANLQRAVSLAPVGIQVTRYHVRLFCKVVAGTAWSGQSSSLILTPVTTVTETLQ